MADLEEAWKAIMSRLLLVVAGLTLAGLVVPASGPASAPSCLVPTGRVVSSQRAPLRFGIYPGGPVGSVNAKAPARAEIPVKRLAALRTLAGPRPFVAPFVARLYSAWTGDAAADDVSGWLDQQIAGYTAAGLQVELVVRYKPAAAGGSSPAAFADYVRALVRRYGSDPRFVSLQITNEANLPDAPGAADGAFTGALTALVDGVIAAKAQARQDGHGHLGIGFSWAYDERPAASREFWARLGRLGGRRFARAVDWVGLDSYPATWQPQLALSSALPARAAGAVKDSVRALRDCYMPLARLGLGKALHIAENGFPTGPWRSEQLQAQVLDAMVRSVSEISATYGVTDYRWFDLRDSSTSDPSVESQYGITRDDYSPKPAFAGYRDLIGRFSGGGSGVPVAPAIRCRPARLKVSLPRIKSRRPTSLVVRVSNKVVGRVRRARIRRAVRISMRSGRSVVKLKLKARARGHNVTRTRRRAYRVC